MNNPYLYVYDDNSIFKSQIFTALDFSSIKKEVWNDKNWLYGTM